MKVRRLKKYGLSQHRMEEIRAFCYQYPEWKTEIECNRLSLKAINYTGMPHGSGVGNQTEMLALKNEDLLEKMRIIENSAKEADEEIWRYILLGVTEGYRFRDLKAMGMPCEKDKYYEGRRKCYFLVSCKRR